MRPFHSRTRLLGLAAVALACALSGPASSAAQAMTVRLGAPELSSRIMISVPVIVSCSAFDAPREQFDSSAQVTARQASGREVAHGTGTAFSSSSPPALLFPCDATEHTARVTVLADADSPPFHGGQAVFTASAGASAGIPCNLERTCWFDIVGQGAFQGPTTLRMR